jgi:hypothetical protein
MRGSLRQQLDHFIWPAVKKRAQQKQAPKFSVKESSQAPSLSLPTSTEDSRLASYWERPTVDNVDPMIFTIEKGKRWIFIQDAPAGL